MVERPEKVRAELYRVQNGETNEGDRLVSDTPIYGGSGSSGSYSDHQAGKQSNTKQRRIR